MPDPLEDLRDRSLTRRRALNLLGAAGVVAVGAACGGGSSGASRRQSSSTTAGASSAAPSSSTAPVGTVSCVLTPEMTEGPYYLTGEPVRSDITEGRAGTPLALALTVVDATRCTPISGAAVDVWHADAVGNYSGFNASASSRTFLRGTQMTDAAGKVIFQTIYPGWYQGRAVHIHVKVRTNSSDVHTGQLFFDESVTDGVYSGQPYSQHTGQRTSNAQDDIYRGGGAQSTLQATKSGGGYTSALTMGVKT
jgi:protocatechuate 3,4-dioxygenase beta subunit